MIRRLILSNFKSFEEIDITLDPVTLFVGPNNSGKTTALQALTLWDLAVRKWWEQKSQGTAKQRTGVTLNRQDLFAIPIPEIRLLWNDLHTKNGSGKKSAFVYIRMHLEGETRGKPWKAGMELYYANPESMYARPIDTGEAATELPIALNEVITYLPPMSGLSSAEERLEMGSIKRRIGEGRTAEVLRNLLWKLHSENSKGWDSLVAAMRKHFETEILPPEYNAATSLITCHIKEKRHPEMDITSSGRGFQQTLLIFAFLHSQEQSILMLDEPDAHLEILRQESLFANLVDEIKSRDSQLLIATHSESILNLAGQNDGVVAFIGKPHRVKSAKELGKSLLSIRYSDYLTAEETERILYVEGETDIRILKTFAEKLDHPLASLLDRTFVSYLNNDDLNPPRQHFQGIKEAVPGVKGLIVTDRMDSVSPMPEGLVHLQWKRREIENYIRLPDCVYRYVDELAGSGDLFLSQGQEIIRAIVQDQTKPAALRDTDDAFWKDEKISTNWLDSILPRFFRELGLHCKLCKGDYYRLARFMKPDEFDPEVKAMLDSIYSILKPAETP
jgi:hypothetical protein